MKISLDPALVQKVPGLCIGICAARAVDNRGPNGKTEAFRHRCCTETNLMLKINPHFADKEIELYRNLLRTAGITGHTCALEETFSSYVKDLEAFHRKSHPVPVHEETGIKKASLSDLVGSDILMPVNPVMDLIHSGMLKFHVDIHGYAVDSKDEELSVHGGDKPGVWLGKTLCTSPWLCEDAGPALLPETPALDVVILATGLAENRKKVAAARNELARRMREAFERSVEVGWLEGKTNSFETTI